MADRSQKSGIILNRFDGGINNDASPRDIGGRDRNELVSATNVYVDRIGRIVVCGAGTGVIFNLSTTNGDVGDNIKYGYGMFIFHSDYSILSEDNLIIDPVTETATDVLLLANGKNIYIYANGYWHKTFIQLSSSSTAKPEPVLTYVDGVVRICDGLVDTANNRCKWFGYIKRTHFPNLSFGLFSNPTDGSYDGWYVKNIDLARPTVGILGTLGGNATSSSDNTNLYSSTLVFLDGFGDEIGNSKHYIVNYEAEIHGLITSKVSENHVITNDPGGSWYQIGATGFYIYPKEGSGFNIDISDGASNGSINAGVYEFAQSFVYVDNQESLLRRYSTTFTLSSSSIYLKIFAVHPFDPMITGGRIYIRNVSTTLGVTTNLNNKWTLLVDIDFSRGIRTGINMDFSNFFNNGAHNEDFLYSNLSIYELSVDSYDSINGFSPDMVISIGGVGEGYKTACIANRRLWIGNVRRTNSDGEVIVESDRMYKSEKDKFDTFLSSGYVDVATNDGDEIILLLNISDRIFQFKRKNVYVINISQEVEDVEATFRYTGISKKYHACITDYGVAWVNKHGLFLTVGESAGQERIVAKNLIENKINKNIWYNDFNSGDFSIAYDGRSKRIIVIKSNKTSYVFSLRTMAFTEVDNRGFLDLDMTNIVSDVWDGEQRMMFVQYTEVAGAEPEHTKLLYWYDDSPDSIVNNGNLIIETMEYVFDKPWIEKSFASIYVTHKNSDGNVSVYASLLHRNGSTGYILLGDLPDKSSYFTSEFPVNYKDCYSIQIKIMKKNSVTLGSDFEINDISVTINQPYG